MKRRLVLLMVGSLPVAGLIGCGRESDAPVTRLPMPINDGDSCHMCGMLITRHPGPKGQCFVRGAEQPLKFCSTRDLFAYTTQPEALSILRDIYVHDMADMAWENPSDDAFIDGRTAYYVICHPLRGAMGPTLAPFESEVAARDFAEQHNGRLITYADIDVELIGRLGRDC